MCNHHQSISSYRLWEFANTAFVVYLSELVIDYIKHAFVMKFNSTDSDVYACYSAVLSKDVTSHRYEHTSMDPTHAVVNRIGIGMLPLACVGLCVVVKMVKESEDFHPLTIPGIIFFILVFSILVSMVRTDARTC